MSDTVKQEVSESDWTGGLSVLWIFAFLAFCGYSVWIGDMAMLEKIAALLGGYTMLVLKFYFDKKGNTL